MNKKNLNMKSRGSAPNYKHTYKLPYIYKYRFIHNICM